MEELLGWTALAIGALLVSGLARRHPELTTVLIVAFGLRAAAALFHHYVAPLPDSAGDAETFEEVAWKWGRHGFSFAYEQLDEPNSFVYSWFLSMVYATTGHSVLMAQAFSVVAGTIVVYLSWLLTSELWGEAHGKKVAWIAAVFPTLVLYSALTTREPFIVATLLVGLIGVVWWVRKENVTTSIVAFSGFGAAALLHGGMAVILFAFAGLFGLRHALRWLSGLYKARLRLFSIALIGGVVAAGAYTVATGMDIPKLGTPSQMVDVDRLLNRFEFSSRSTASYPPWAVPETGAEIIWKTPIRIFYFLFSPFPWDIDRPEHIIGFLDGLLYIVIFYYLWRNRKVVMEDTAARVVFVVLMSVLLVFGIANGNFGTGLRHRAKFVAGILALTAPRLPRLTTKSRDISAAGETGD